jgi:hypothetical protein
MNYDVISNQLKSGDYARSNLFEVEILIPSIVPDTMRFMVKSASLPGKQLGEVDVKRFGATFKMANDVILSNVTLTIMCSKDMRERDFFETWISYIHGGDPSDLDSPMNYRMGYYDDYIHNIRVTSFDRKLDEAYAIELREAWPNNMGEVALSWDNSEIATFTVGLTYRDWRQVGVSGGMGDEMPKPFNPVKDSKSSTNVSNNTDNTSSGVDLDIQNIINN